MIHYHTFGGSRPTLLLFSLRYVLARELSRNNQAKKKTPAESKSDKTAIVSSANCSSLDSKSFYIRLISSWFLMPVGKISIALTERWGTRGLPA